MTSPRALLNAHGLRPRKRLGQNFLADPSTAQMIVVRAQVQPTEHVVEIGAGLGALSLPLARAAARIVAFEKDADLARILREELQAAGVENVSVREADILQVDWAELARTAGGPLTVFGNLPYLISAPVLLGLIHARGHLRRAVLMFQRELAMRLRAVPGSRDYGRITAMLHCCATVRRLASVASRQFYPAPQVDSEVLELRFTPPPAFPSCDDERLFRLIGAAFGRRRKTLKNALCGSELGIGPETAARALTMAGIDPARRAETLAPTEFAALEICLRRLEEESAAAASPSPGS
jgi:16S rRNA (adenine1518-N6/adenine1519-N6)-dimethyltransferase